VYDRDRRYVANAANQPAQREVDIHASSFLQRTSCPQIVRSKIETVSGDPSSGYSAAIEIAIPASERFSQPAADENLLASPIAPAFHASR
jgi:hypothetical protein